MELSSIAIVFPILQIIISIWSPSEISLKYALVQRGNERQAKAFSSSSFSGFPPIHAIVLVSCVIPFCYKCGNYDFIVVCACGNFCGCFPVVYTAPFVPQSGATPSEPSHKSRREDSASSVEWLRLLVKFEKIWAALKCSSE